MNEQCKTCRKAPTCEDKNDPETTCGWYDPVNPKDGGSAFPIQFDDRPGSYQAEPGMTLRDWFAGRALTGQVAFEGLEGCDARLITKYAYEMADAMLKARA
jgi:hypothetical protein